MKRILYPGDNWPERIRTAARCRDCDDLPKVPEAGEIFADGPERWQWMHNGVRILADSYYNEWLTEIIRILRGHHEPQEERVFAEVLKNLPDGAVMLELGSYWAYYSLWFHKAVRNGRNILVEPDPEFLALGRRHFEANGARGTFIHAAISNTSGDLIRVDTDNSGPLVPTVSVADLSASLQLEYIHLLHCDIQGNEVKMLEGAIDLFEECRLGYVFISTHSEDLHQSVVEFLGQYGFRIIASHTPAESYSFDGLVVAANPKLALPAHVPVSKRSAVVENRGLTCVHNEGIAVKVDGQPSTLLISCADERGHGGLYALDSTGLFRVDHLNTTSVCVHGDELYRLLWSQPGGDAVVLRYRSDGAGVTVGHLPGCGDAHQLISAGEDLVLVKTWQNSIAWLNPDLSTKREWVATPEEDAWHLNSATWHDDKVVATAFGRFDHTRGWSGVANSGILFDVETGRNIVSGLTCPHNAVPFEEGWLICESWWHSLRVQRGAHLQVVHLGAFTRGLSLTDDFILVGLSGHRYEGKSAQARLAVLDRNTLEVRSLIPVPSTEIGTVSIVSNDWLRRITGARIPILTQELELLSQSRPLDYDVASERMQPLSIVDVQKVRVHIERAPQQARAGKMFHVLVWIKNGSAAELRSAPDFPVFCSYHWVDQEGRSTVFEGRRTKLSRSLRPGQRQLVPLEVVAPDEPGSYWLNVTAVQEGVCWFDQDRIGVVAGVAVSIVET